MKTANEIKMACDPDLMVNMVVNDSAHIARAKAKAARVHLARHHAAAKAKAHDNLIAAVGVGIITSICTGTIGLLVLALSAIV